ncbi:rhodanese-like domain-containing protein [Enterococcus sp. LJL120]
MYQTISMKDFYQQATQKKLHILDVRPVEGFFAGHVPDAVSLPLEELPENLAQLSKDQKYYIICRSGQRSQRASEFLAEAGYDVTNVAGGTLAWPGTLEK